MPLKDSFPDPLKMAVKHGIYLRPCLQSTEWRTVEEFKSEELNRVIKTSLVFRVAWEQNIQKRR